MSSLSRFSPPRFVRFLAMSLVGLALASGCNSGSNPGSGSAAGSSGGASAAPVVSADGTIEILNVSYDPTRELWAQVNEAFVPEYQTKTGKKLTIKPSHGGSGSQARSVIEGLPADVVTLAIWPDVDAIRKAGLIEEGWENRLPNGSLPYTSTIVFVVRKGNPKGVKDWTDLVKPGIEVITPNPKTSGNGKLSFLGAWGSVTERGGSVADAEKFVADLYKNVPVLDSGARGATVTFAEKLQGDVHLTWENEAHREIAEYKKDGLEIVYPPISILAEPTVAWVDEVVKKKSTTEIAKAYLEFLYTPKGQEIIAKNFYRPTDISVLEKHKSSFPPITLFKVEKIAGNWTQAQAKYFASGALFDKIFVPPAAK